MNAKDRRDEKAAARERLRAHLKACVPGAPEGGSVVHIRWLSGAPTSTGRTDRYDVEVWAPPGEGSPTPYVSAWLTRNYAIASGHRFAASHEAVAIGGYGLNKAHAIATDLADIAGHPIVVSGSYSGTIDPSPRSDRG